jgi:hypothetical protein
MSATSRQRSYTRLEAELLYVRHTDCPKACFVEWWTYNANKAQRIHSVTHEEFMKFLGEFKGRRSTGGKPVSAVGRPAYSAAAKRKLAA